jgi:hypothetical protein
LLMVLLLLSSMLRIATRALERSTMLVVRG